MSIFSGRTRSSSSSLLKSTPSLKTRLSKIQNTPAKVKFVLPQSKKVRSILSDYTRKDSVKEYENLVCSIRDAELVNDDISALLKEATECISLMNNDLRLFIEALLSINWIEQSDRVTTEYKSFIVNLVSAHNYHAEFVIAKLIKLFSPAPTDAEWEKGSPSQSDCKKCQHVHSLLNGLLTVVPMCKDLLMNALIHQFPYIKRGAHVHEYYIQNLLWIAHYQPKMRPDILHLIFSKLIILDVHVPREAIENAMNEDEIFDMDDEARSVVALSNLQEIAHTLDISLDKMFVYFITECHNPETNEVDWDKTKSLYHDMLGVFDRIILPTYNSHHVQFIMFVMCSFRPSLAEAFFNYLWKKICNPNVPSILRQAAINYMVSFMARAAYLPPTMVKATMQQMADWIHAYIAAQDGLESINSDVRMHSVFYALCQGLFYTIAFLHKALIKTRKDMVFVESLNLGKIVTSRLNPLRVCQLAVVQNFAAITRNYQLAYCYSVIEHNSRNTLPMVYHDDKGSVVISDNVLEAYYPFDPYILPRSSEKVYPEYRDYEEEEINLDEEMEEEVPDTDDFLEHDTSASSRAQIFSYGSSPGFKFKT